MGNVLSNIKQTLQQKRVRNLLIGLYVLLIIGLSASARADGLRIFPQPPKQTMSTSIEDVAQKESFFGVMEITLDGRALLTSGDEYIELKSDKDLSAFHGHQVEVIGVKEFYYKVGPVYQLQAVIPPQMAEAANSEDPVVIVSDVIVI